MFRLTREVRLAVGKQAPAPAVINGHAGYPGLRGIEPFITVRVTLGGEVDERSGYLINIKQVDSAVRRDGFAVLQYYAAHKPQAPAQMTAEIFDRLLANWPQLQRVEVLLSPYCGYAVLSREHPMVRFSQKFEFSAAHRLHNPRLDAAKNLEMFGKCNNPHGHGHNYELQVTLRGKPDESGQLIPAEMLEEVVIKNVIDKFDHKFLNIQMPEFAELNPTVENIAKTIYGMLKIPLRQRQAELAAVTVWETPKTWCEYEE